MSATHNTKVSGVAKADWRVDPDNRQNRCSGPVTVRKATPEELEKYKDIKPYKKPSMVEVPSLVRKDRVDMANSKITPEQLLAECKELGIDKKAFKMIAEKYGLKTGSIEFYFYDWKIKDKLPIEKPVEEEPVIENKPVSVLEVENATETVIPPKEDTIKGIGKDAEKVVNGAGGKQSKLDYRFDLMDSRAMFELAAVLSHGAEEYGVDNWRKIPSRDHINHAITHLYAHLAGDTQDEHLSHAFCRLMMAVGTKE